MNPVWRSIFAGVITRVARLAPTRSRVALLSKTKVTLPSVPIPFPSVFTTRARSFRAHCVYSSRLVPAPIPTFRLSIHSHPSSRNENEHAVDDVGTSSLVAIHFNSFRVSLRTHPLTMALFATVAMVTACMFGRLSLYVFVRVRFARATDDERRRDERRARSTASPWMSQHVWINSIHRVFLLTWRDRSCNMSI